MLGLKIRHVIHIFVNNDPQVIRLFVRGNLTL